MIVRFGEGNTEYGPGVEILLNSNELATAISAYLHAHGVIYHGPRTIRVNGGRCESAKVYVDPSGYVMFDGDRYNGRTGKIE